LIAENAAKAEAAAAKAKAAAEKARNAAKRLFEETKKAIEQGKESLREYAAGLADTVRGWISLSNAVSAGTESETAYQDALKERMAAYEELNKLQKSGLYTTEQMADATERVTRAEAGLNTAQSNRKSYSQQFADQIAAAKKFGGQLQQLIAAGLGKSGLAQLMNLGPVAGSQVAADLLAGTGGMTVASLNTDLASIDTAGVALGADAIAGDMSLLNQASATRSGNTISITVTSADPNAVVAALQKYVRTSGPVPIRIRNP
jgi:alkylhydroperoxidase/carboxymuconolactone decarboxylase family protein YurZ